jgi:hypothetical protein
VPDASKVVPDPFQSLTGKPEQGHISFQSFLGFPIDQTAPDHSTSSRSRCWLPKAAMLQINSALLNQFHANDLSINKVVAINARLIKSAPWSISNDKIKQLKD